MQPSKKDKVSLAREAASVDAPSSAIKPASATGPASITEPASADLAANYYSCKLLAKDQVNPNTVFLTFAGREIATQAEPGQFVLVASHTFLKRPMGVAWVDRAQGTFAVGVRLLGKGTRNLGALTPGQELEVLGPLGKGFETYTREQSGHEWPGPGDQVLLIGGGTGVFPLLFLSQILQAQSLPFDLVLGFQSVRDLVRVKDFEKASSGKLRLCLDHLPQAGGSGGDADEAGEKTGKTGEAREAGSSWGEAEVLDRDRIYEGTVLAALKALPVASWPQKVHLFLCGPDPMVKAVLGLIATWRKDYPQKTFYVQASLEARMACGVGFCAACSLPFRKEEGAEITMQRVCADGPVFDPDQVAWELIAPSRPAGHDQVKEDVSQPLATSFLGQTLSTPLMTASGCSGFGEDYFSLAGTAGLGAFVTKAVTLHPRAGNRPPRVVEFSTGILNSVGLENPGLGYFLQEILPHLEETGLPYIINIAGSTLDDYLALAEGLRVCKGLLALEVNLSCPNVRDGCMSIGTHPEMVGAYIKALQGVTNIPLIAKLTPNVQDITAPALAAAEAGADAVSLINTVVGMAVDLKRRQPVLCNNVGGYSGPGVKPIALRMVAETYRAFQAAGLACQIIGMGGIRTPEDALEFIMAGADVLSVGTEVLRHYDTIPKLADGMIAKMKELGIPSVGALHGTLCYHEESPAL